MYLKRLLDVKAKKYLKIIGSISIEGPKWCGKTESSKQLSSTNYFLNNSNTLINAKQNINSLFVGKNPILIDEWQKLPELWDEVKDMVDSIKKNGLFILCGSTTIAKKDYEKITHDGSGRIAKLSLRTMSLTESCDSCMKIDFNSLFIKNTKVKSVNTIDEKKYFYFMIRGGWPNLIKKSESTCLLLLKKYTENISSVDAKEISNKINKERVASLLRSIARNIGTDVSNQTLANDANISTNTVAEYLDVLKNIYIYEPLYSWNTHVRSSISLRTSPKKYFADPSLAISILNINSKKLINDYNFVGFLFESMVIRDLRIYAELIDAEIHYYRDNTGLEIDAIIELPDGTWSAFEIKYHSEDGINEGIKNLLKLKNRLSESVWSKVKTLNIITARQISRTTSEGVNIISFIDLFFKQH